ncbi:MaoC/PaaZ C-terminal domain-containing protein [Streptomyces hirsutus]|uniref:MaoC/PaaZ C-terminal domain-containing protein n=1 Tax=Streptomyces hirsutus TaxID=35620 RepID=UPI003417BFED
MNASTTPSPATVPTLEPGPITRTKLALFAGASGDHNPIHIDTDVARAAGMEDVIAHGMLSMAYLGRLLTEWIPQDRIRELSARFTAMTPVLAEPVLTGEVVETFEQDGEKRARLALSVALADGTQTLKGSAVITWP